MSLDPQYPQGAGGLFRATSTSKLPAPLGHNVIESVPGTVPVGKAADGTLVTPAQSPVPGGAVATVPAAQIIAGTLGSYTADTTYITADTAGGVERGTFVCWDTSMAAWVFDFYRSAKVL